MTKKLNLVKSIVYQTALPAAGKVLCNRNQFINCIYYHDIVPENGYSYMRINKSLFEKQMRYLAEKGYRTYLFHELDDPKAIQFDKKSVLITFDDGWKSNHTFIFNLMKELGLKYNIFLAAGSINEDPDYLTWDEVEQMAGSGMCGFGAHTYDHVTCEDVSSIDFDRQVRMTDDLIELHTGHRPKDFCFPKGVYTADFIQKLEMDSAYSRIYTSDLNYSYERNGIIVFGRNAISNDESMKVFKNKVRGYYNVFQKLRGGLHG